VHIIKILQREDAANVGKSMIVPIKQCVLNVPKKTLYIKRRHEIGIEIMDIALVVKGISSWGKKKHALNAERRMQKKQN
jgi:hypothetical protein